MKFLHTADLHIGKRVNGFSMIEDQRHVLEQILQYTHQEKPDGILIAGDVYDKSQPATEAVELLDEFLTKLTEMGQAVFMISGNHDSPERLGFGSRIMEKNGLYIAGVFDGELQRVQLKDEYGPVGIYLLPFLKPALVRPFFEQQIDSYENAVRAVISAAGIDADERNILVAHQFIVSGTIQPERTDSESQAVGGIDSVDVSLFDDFDYVALGHLHRSQRIGRDCVRYAGSPIKYSFSEALHQKSVTIINLGAKGEVVIDKLPLAPLRDLREIKGPIAELIKAGEEDSDNSKDYIHAILTDEEELYDALGQLRRVYPNLMALDFENSRFAEYDYQGHDFSDTGKINPLELFVEFYKMQNNNELSPKQTQMMEGIFEQVGGEGI